jgi:hypothetical protein
MQVDIHGLNIHDHTRFSGSYFGKSSISNFMRHITHIFLVLMLFSSSAFAKSSLSDGDNLKIAIMTMGPYQPELYSAFGHSAIRVIDTARAIDYVFNYGVFDFQQENFYWNFGRGKMLYQLGLSNYDRFKNHYISENRSITEQYLNLTSEEKQAFFDFLVTNYEPENRQYYYNYVYDNCATKMRDVIRGAVTAQVTFDTSFVEQDVTIRDLMHRYLAYQPWGDWIIDIGLGYQIDKIADAEEYMFLPDYIEEGLANATIQRNGVEEPFVSETVRVFEAVPQTFENSIFSPFNTFVIVFFLIGFITNRDFKRQTRTHWVDVVLFTFVGIFGWWCTFLWLGTDHLSKMNMNLLWAIPLHIPLIYMLRSKRHQVWISKYFLYVSILYIAVIVLWGVIPQPLHMALIPLILVMALRGFLIYYDVNSFSKKASR